MNIAKIDTLIGITQKMAIIIGLAVSAWIFIIKEETSPHVKLTSTTVVFPPCILRVNVEVENKGGRAWDMESAIARVFDPGFSRIKKSEDLKDSEIGTQILRAAQRIRIGETASFGFNIEVPKNNRSFVIVKTAIKIKEENDAWIVEEAVPLTNCS